MLDFLFLMKGVLKILICVRLRIIFAFLYLPALYCCCCWHHFQVVCVHTLLSLQASLASQVDDLMEEVDETKRQFARKSLEQAELHDSSRLAIDLV